MNHPHYLYLMISRTDTGFGAFIRMLFRFPYNHCALTLDPSFRNWVAFGRFHRDAPLYGGFIQEPVERYLSKGIDAQVRIFRIEISKGRYDVLQQLFSKAGNENSGLIYNVFDAVTTFFRFQFPVADAYTCLGFARTVLGKDYPTIKHLNDDQMPNLYYEGNLSELAPDSGLRTDPYFLDISRLDASLIGLKQVARLASRTIRQNRQDLVKQQLRNHPF